MRGIRALPLLFLFGPALAQESAPDPLEQALRAADQGRPEEATARLQAMIQEVMSASPGKVIRQSLGDYQTAQKDRYARSLQPAPGQPSPQGRPPDPLKFVDVPRFRRESTDFGVLQPTERITLGVGRSESRLLQRDRVSAPTVDKYLFLKIQLSKPTERKKGLLLFPPHVTRTETEVSPSNRVSVEEHDKGFKELKEILP